MQTTGRGRPNRQPQDEGSDRGTSRGTGRGRGRGRGRGQTPNPNFTHSPRPQHRHPRLEHSSIPSFAAIKPGTGVSIVLKQDQTTGHQVRGLVADLLTRGDHPRGVKVRLRDGRVGRVQGIVSEVEGERGEALVGGSEANLGRNGPAAVGGRGGAGGRVGGRMERDIREDDEYLYEARKPADVGLFAALEEADQRHQQRSKGRGTEELKSGIAKCPVCGVFEGDEAAVAHHVEEHFKD
ncbi:uncharacterized protein K460DRAFT_367882 [Cucurbitaria berberidis CBS 394.84]|uniref:UBZ4-type domain-containing protein n=1 Tax=Cucurbitaria berberidis CBS 394.84 TaxID=1168544 RepID=A0A9P4L6E1_9PLEO|nr:uncharacterized protein K460DRAFT_367882 [Cucurbitaria berberidis CBS 394.84]KAF1842963.1 hypothetical protein K460DRAFT_367882 [Cucurbitaria berberidis CBS 394.84]